MSQFLKIFLIVVTITISSANTVAEVNEVFNQTPQIKDGYSATRQQVYNLVDHKFENILGKSYYVQKIMKNTPVSPQSTKISPQSTKISPQNNKDQINRNVDFGNEKSIIPIIPADNKHAQDRIKQYSATSELFKNSNPVSDNKPFTVNPPSSFGIKELTKKGVDKVKNINNQSKKIIWNVNPAQQKISETIVDKQNVYSLNQGGSQSTVPAVKQHVKQAVKQTVKQTIKQVQKPEHPKVPESTKNNNLQSQNRIRKPEINTSLQYSFYSLNIFALLIIVSILGYLLYRYKKQQKISLRQKIKSVFFSYQKINQGHQYEQDLLSLYPDEQDE